MVSFVPSRTIDKIARLAFRPPRLLTHVQGFLAEGLTRTSAGMGSVIIDSQPLSVAVLAALLFGEKLTPLGVLGLGLGVAGLGLLEVPGQDLAEAAGEGGGATAAWRHCWLLFLARGVAAAGTHGTFQLSPRLAGCGQYVRE